MRNKTSSLIDNGEDMDNREAKVNHITPIDASFLKSLKGTLTNMTKSDLEELVTQKICEVITERSNVGNFRRRAQILELEQVLLVKRLHKLSQDLVQTNTVVNLLVNRPRGTRSVGVQTSPPPVQDIPVSDPPQSAPSQMKPTQSLNKSCVGLLDKKLVTLPQIQVKKLQTDTIQYYTRRGYSTCVDGGMEANCSCCLVKGKVNCIVDTMTAWDGDRILSALQLHGMLPEHIHFVISTHGHSDHMGNNNLFLKATHIVGFCVSHKNKFKDHPFQDGIPMYLDDGLYVIPTPGHTLSDVSLVVENVPQKGTVVIAGDLFEKEEDLSDDRIWKSAGSENEQLQISNRIKVLTIADWIVPGHGKMFKNYKKAEI